MEGGWGWVGGGGRKGLTALAVAQAVLVNLLQVRPGRAGLCGTVVDAPGEVWGRAEAYGCGLCAAEIGTLCDEVVHARLLVRRVSACVSLIYTAPLAPRQDMCEMLVRWGGCVGEGGGILVLGRLTPHCGKLLRSWAATPATMAAAGKNALFMLTLPRSVVSCNL